MPKETKAGRLQRVMSRLTPQPCGTSVPPRSQLSLIGSFVVLRPTWGRVALRIPSVRLAEAVLSFIGFSFQPKRGGRVLSSTYSTSPLRHPSADDKVGRGANGFRS